MGDILTADFSDLKQWSKFYKQLPKMYQRSIAGLLNSMAFHNRQEEIEQLKQLTTVRTPSLLRLLMRVEKADASQSIDTMQSRAGSIMGKVDRHDEFLHIAVGSATRATVFTEEGRGGSFAKKATKQARAIRSEHTEMRDFNLSGGGNDRMQSYFQAIAGDQTRRRKAFFLPRRYKSMKSGVYKFKGGRVGTYNKSGRKVKSTLVGASIKKLSTPGSTMKPKRIPWNVLAAKETMRPVNIRKWWIDNNIRQLEKIAKRYRLR